MTHFNETINLMAFRGALRATMQHPLSGGKAITGTFIPDAWNDVTVAPAYGEAGRRGEIVANVKLFMEGYSQAYMDRARQNRLMQGESMDKWQPASHRVSIKFNEDTERKATKQVLPEILGQHPEWNTADLQNPDYNKDLVYALRDRLRIPVGKAYAVINHEDRQLLTPQPAAPTQPAQPWTPDQPADDYSGFQNTPEDLPF